ncbi:unnamed protein product [Paramecium primaurelia]|uniref:WD40-repeat-containing domain n=1 Tax=Paramecium primaurelia TaxID=5886 RepID=A0A8S1L6B5_PARPR|nr:unnamed protein product [Paramecium primaurelia]
MSSQILSNSGVPKLICQKAICEKQNPKNKEIFSCNLQKTLNDDAITDCKGCIGKQKDRNINYCQINFQDFFLQLITQRKEEQEIKAQVSEMERRLQQIVENAKQEIDRAEVNIKKIGETIKSMCLFQNNSKLEECLRLKEQTSLDLVKKMIKEFREKITIIEDNQQQNNQQININPDKLNIIYENGTIIIDDFLKKKLSQMSQMLNSFELQVQQINRTNDNFIQQQNQIINTNYKQIGKVDNLKFKKIYNLRFNRSNNLFAFGTNNLDNNKAYCAEIWKIDNNKIKQVQQLQQYPDVTALCFSKKDDSLFTGSLDSKIIYWIPQSDGQYKEQELKIRKDIKGQINYIEINQKSNILAVGSEELNIYTIKNNELLQITQYLQQVKNLAFSNCNQIIIAQFMINNKEKIELFQIKQTGENFEIINLGEVIQTQEIQPITTTRFLHINLQNQINLFQLDNNRFQKIENYSIKKLNSIEKCGIGFCSNNNNRFNLLAFSQNINNNQITQILKINEQNQVTLLQSIQQIGLKLFFSNNGQLLVIWNGDSFVIYKNTSQTI